MTESVVPEPLVPLVQAMGRDVSRLVVRPGWVVADRDASSQPLELDWTSEQHAAALAATGDGLRVTADTSVRALDGTLVLVRAPSADRTMETLIQEGKISSLAGRVLTYGMALGRNILLASTSHQARSWVAALVAHGKRPAVLGPKGGESAGRWPLISTVEDSVAYGADRVGVWGLGPETLAGIMASRTGVAGWIDAPRLDHALMRLEAAIERARPGLTTPLQVLASVNLIMVMSGGDQPRVQQVVEIDVTEDGYRPRMLFVTGQAPVASALVPVGLPSFIDELGEIGQHVLADDLRHAVGAMVQAAPAPQPAAPPRAPQPEPAMPREEVIPPQGAPVAPAQPAPTPDPDLAAAPPPGWELDMLGDDPIEGADDSAQPEHAVLAATFGLAPPPAPPGVSPEGNPSFEDALRRAKERDAELKAELGDDYITASSNVDEEG